MPILQPAPIAGSARYEADRQIFKQTRSFAGSARWVLATNDVQLDTASMMRDFSCAAGVTLTVEALPQLTRLLSQANADTRAQTNAAKDRFKRQRPFLIDNGPTCQPASELAGTYDYPSGHTTSGWTWASILAELMPARANQILARGRAFGESRIVCGAHNASAVEAGRLSSAATLAVVRAASGYQNDFAAARDELAKASPSLPVPPAAQCAGEKQLVDMPVIAQ
jgi:acid phosphatase (class A)